MKSKQLINLPLLPLKLALKLTFLISIMFVVSSCLDEDNLSFQTENEITTIENENTSTENDVNNDEPNNIQDPTNDETNNNQNESNETNESIVLGEALYAQYCIGCHLVDGSGPTGANLIDCITCTDKTALSHRINETMPPSDSSVLDINQAELIALYIINSFNSAQKPEQSTSVAFINTLTSKESVYKLAFDLAATTPTATQLNNFESDSEMVIDQWLESENFYKKLMSFYNKKLKTDSFHSRFERESNYKNARDLLRACERGMGNTCNNTASDRMLYFPNNRWWDDLPFEGVIADLTNDAIAREPLEFIRFVAKNNLPFSEILTADYALVNVYSAKSLDAKHLDGTLIQPEDFKKIVAPTINTMINGVEQDSIYLVPFKEQLRTLNRLRGSDVQLNIGNDSKIEEFINYYPQDPTHYIPAKIEQTNIDIPLAGILTTKAFLNKFTTTPTNKQRTRANMVYNIFAATDILAIEANRDASLVDFSDSTGSVDPTKTNEDCLVCHRKLDPVADSFKNWLYNGTYKNSACQDSANINSCATKPTVGIGFEGTLAPIFGNNSVDSNSLQWLAKTIAADPLFAKSVVHTLFEGFTGKNVLINNPNEDAAYQKEYSLQQGLLSTMIDVYNQSNEDIKSTTKTLITSDYYLAKEIIGDNTLLNVGSDRILGADQLQNKFYATTKHISSTSEVDDSFKLNLGNRATWKMYGGVDGLNTHDLPNEQGGIMLTIQERLANEMACFVTAQDLYREPDKRLFMQNISYKMVQGNTAVNDYVADELEIKKTIVHMHLHFWHQEVSINSKEVSEVYALFTDVLTMGINLRQSDETPRNVASYCRVDYEPDTNELLVSSKRAYRDDQYTVRAWSVITAYFLGDFKFSHI
ncbi:MAG: hypothetical protein HRU38_21490 [Saccharospirillaceae bacterium]|nr:cytochrome c [Pseudomonadales bacterium]NRB81204.1 hypothetical protein [Saccharospirillaceae bacterium]